ncbi:unnamed protein product, partial [Prorocentrum cordatum]
MPPQSSGAEVAALAGLTRCRASDFITPQGRTRPTPEAGPDAAGDKAAGEPAGPARAPRGAAPEAGGAPGSAAGSGAQRSSRSRSRSGSSRAAPGRREPSRSVPRRPQGPVQCAASSMSPEELAERRQVREQCLLNRRRMCRFFAKGDCQKGVFCIWAHGEAELDTTPQLGHRPRNTRLCIHFQAGWCGQGKACPYAHGTAELVASPRARAPQAALGSAGAGRCLALPAPPQPSDPPARRASLRPNAKKRAAPAAAPPQKNGRATLVPGRGSLRSHRSRSRSAHSPCGRGGAARPAAAAGQ